MQKESKSKRKKDNCPICKTDLYINEKVSERVGMLDEDDGVFGWMCPHCKSQFDLHDIVTNINGDMPIQGEA